ncbi:MAG: YraN family protein [Cyanobacteria bacterium J06641_5]
MLPLSYQPPGAVLHQARSRQEFMTAADDLGALGEDLVARWLQQEGGQILARRWRCRWGELDLIARDRAGAIQFIEVKTRSGRSWDAGGLLAISPRKQQCLYRSAMAFLSQHPDWAELPCQFYLALVRGQRRPRIASPTSSRRSDAAIALEQMVACGCWDLALQTYAPLELELA